MQHQLSQDYENYHMPLGSRHAVVENCKIANYQSTVFMTVLKGNRYVVIWKCLEYISGDYTVNQYFTNSDSTWWARHNEVVPLGHPGHEWVKTGSHMKRHSSCQRRHFVTPGRAIQ